MSENGALPHFHQKIIGALHGHGLHAHESQGGIGQLISPNATTPLCENPARCFRIRLNNVRPDPTLRPNDSPIKRLSGRQLEAVDQLAQGKTIQEAAEAMLISYAGVAGLIVTARSNAGGFEVGAHPVSRDRLMYLYGQWVAMGGRSAV